MSGIEGGRMGHTKGGLLSSRNLHFGGRDRSIFLNHSDECVNYKLRSAVEERKLRTSRVQNSRSGLTWKKCPLKPRMSRSYLRDRVGHEHSRPEGDSTIVHLEEEFRGAGGWGWGWLECRGR